jgi:anti-sigma factor RsiW
MNPELDARLSALLDGELSPEEAEALRAEIARSPELTLQLAALAAVDDGLRALPSPRLPSDLRVRLARRVREDVPARPRAPGAARRRAPRSGAIPGWLAAAAVAAAAAAVLAFVVLPQLGREETPLARVEPEPAPPAPAHEEPASEDLALADDLPVIEVLDVLDVLAELDELEGVGSG